MPLFTRLRSRNAYCAVFALLFLAATYVTALGAKAWLSPPAPSMLAPAAPQVDAGKDAPEAEVVTILPAGFEPSQITRPRGGFLLVVNNRAGLEQVVWRLDREGGGRLHEVRLSEGRLGSKQYLDLPPGDYVLTEAADAGRACRITITPR